MYKHHMSVNLILLTLKSKLKKSLFFEDEQYRCTCDKTCLLTLRLDETHCRH